MKTKNINIRKANRKAFFTFRFSFFTSLLLLAAIMTGCSPDDYSMGGAQYTADQLKAPDAYTVTINGNRVTLTSKLVGCTPLWVTPNGRSQEQEVTLELPFAGEYEVTLGAETRAGAVFGEPYKFTIAQNDFTMLDNPLWFYLADKNYTKGSSFPDEQTLIEGISKKWYPGDKDYGLGFTGPVMYMTPYDVKNDGSGTDEEKANVTYKPVPFGRANWAPNFDPGFQSWLVAEDDPYMDSYMEFSMDAANGCVAKVYRGESGSKGNSTGKNLVGKFNLGLLDKDHPTISFSDCFALHNMGFDEVCSNYTQDIIIAEMTPYYLCLVTKRTNSEGNWYIVWNFVSEEVKETDGACIPKEEVQLLEKSDPVLPEFGNLATDMFTVESNGVTYVGNAITYTVNADVPYDLLHWNGAPQANAWESVTHDGEYNNSWAPMPGDDAWDNELTITKNSNGTYSYTYGESEGTMTIGEGTVTFSDEVTFLTVSNDSRTVAVKGTTFTILKMAAAEGMTLGVPDQKDAKGNVTSYLVVNLDTKPIGGGQTGPLVVPLTEDYAEHSWVENSCFRLGFHHYGDGGTGIFKDASSVKLKKGQAIKVTFTLKSDVTWIKAPKCALIDNNIKTTWEPGCFDLEDAVLVNLTGETTVTLVNNTDATQKFTPTCLDLSIQLDGYLDGFDSSVTPDLIQSMKCVIE